VLRGVCESHFGDQNTIDVFVPQSGCFRVSLEVSEDGNDPTTGDWWFAETVLPPIAELFVHDHVEWLFWGRGFSKGIADVASESNVLEGSNQ
jgi:hypothetical protein